MTQNSSGSAGLVRFACLIARGAGFLLTSMRFPLDLDVDTPPLKPPSETERLCGRFSKTLSWTGDLTPRRPISMPSLAMAMDAAAQVEQAIVTRLTSESRNSQSNAGSCSDPVHPSNAPDICESKEIANHRSTRRKARHSPFQIRESPAFCGAWYAVAPEAHELLTIWCGGGCMERSTRERRADIALIAF